MHGVQQRVINRHFAMTPFAMPWLYTQWVWETQMELWQQHVREAVDILSMLAPPRRASWAEQDQFHSQTGEAEHLQQAERTVQ